MDGKGITAEERKQARMAGLDRLAKEVPARRGEFPHGSTEGNTAGVVSQAAEPRCRKPEGLGRV